MQHEVPDHIYTKTDTDIIFKKVAFLLVFASIAAGILVISKAPSLVQITKNGGVAEKIVTFSSDSEAKAYIQETKQLEFLTQLDSRSIGEATQTTAIDKLSASPSRVSTTNVQVLGVDEPDIVKTDGKRIFFSSNQIFYPLSMPERGLIEDKPSVPIENQAKTQVIQAFPIETTEIAANIPQSGDLLLSDNSLVIFSNQSIYGYDVTDSKNPQEKWKLDLEDSSILTSRLIADKLYIVTQKTINYSNPCPMPLIKTGLGTISVACTDIYYPGARVPVDSTFTIFEVNPQSGTVGKKLTFLGSASQSVIYVSNNALYLSYTKQNDLAKLYYQFFVEDGANLLPDNLVQKIKVLETYDISSQSKLSEIQLIINQYSLSLGQDDQLKFQQELTNRMTAFTGRHLREIEETVIVKIPLASLEIEKNGTVPGTPLNQFSLDEYNQSLRIATTASGGFFGSTQSISDVYVLDDTLKITGAVQNMGKGERIYAVRFIEDKGYVVTFRQVDPFYVLDLTDPKNPLVKGELKIPGYSSYLHPINKNTIIGVGREDQNVKLSLFDVTSPETPQEIAKYTMSEIWSEALSDHHAFLLDETHQVFFVPGSQGGYIFSYEGRVFTLKKAVTMPAVKRALFIDNYFYVIGTGKLTVLDEITWNTVKEIDL